MASSDNFALAVFAVVAAPFIPALLAEFFYYWFHRAQHTIPFMWRFHAVHHAIEELNVANSAHHITEGFFRLAFMGLPVAVLVQLEVPQVLFISIFLTVWSIFIHANSRISLGPLDYLFVRPFYHRIHHSMDAVHHNRNFCALFPIWDMLFGTAYFPAHDERVKTGLLDKCEAKTISQYLLARVPLRDEAFIAARRTDMLENSTLMAQTPQEF
jgi:sterol desaturase/sphingolipid hydroxylase (fatty acid hydroxylase superfamily)